MDLNFSHESFAFSDIAPPSHVSDLESFSDFDLSEASETSFVEFAPQITTGSGENIQGSNQSCNQNGENSSKENDRFSLGLQQLSASNIQDFLAAIKSSQSQGFLASGESATSLVSGDESSLGILQLDALSNLSENLQNVNLSDKESKPLHKTLDGNETLTKTAENEVDDLTGENIPSCGVNNEVSNLAPGVMRHMTEEQRPDTGQDPDTFFSSKSGEGNITERDNGDNEPSQLSSGHEELRVMLQRRSGSGDGGELIDRVSLTSSISFIQSQTFPESIFSQSFSSTSRGLGSGMDSHSGSDNDDDDDGENTLPLQHGAGDGSNGSIRRPGLEGANSDLEDLPAYNVLGTNTSVRQETEGLGLRQSAEGVDVAPFVLGDGGGGGDGSSGNDTDDDDGGPAGAPYASSSASVVLPASIATTTHLQLISGSIHYSSSSHTGDTVLSAGRGCPVGDVDVDRSPVLIPNMPEQLNDAGELLSTPLPLYLQATSTPLVRQDGREENDSTIVNDETSAFESRYLIGNKPSNDLTAGSSFQPSLAEESSFNISQVLKRRSSNTMTEAESLQFDTLANESVPSHSIAQGVDTARSVQSDAKEESGRGERLQPFSTMSSSHESDLSVKLSRNTFIDRSSLVDDSQLWKSTPRVSEDVAIRATPGIVFQGNQRPSTVTGQANLSDPQPSLAFINSLTVPEPGLERTLTPGMAIGEITNTQPSDGFKDTSTPAPWSPGEFVTRTSVPGRNPFDSTDSMQNGNSFLQGEPSDIPSWTFNRDSAVGRNPFDDDDFDDYGNSFAMGADFDFEPQGDAAAILAADEENFNREHQFEVMSVAQTSDISRQHDWTIPHDQFITRPSLLRVIGINDPNDIGEVRVSFGKFLAAKSEELGSLSRTSPDRPRPTFGSDKTIISPPQLEENLHDTSVAKTSVSDKQKKKQSSEKSAAQNLASQGTFGKHGKHREVAEKLSNAAASHHQGSLSWEMQKLQMDENYKKEIKTKCRSQSASQTSSHSSSSKSSVRSVIKNDKDKREQIGESKRIARDESKAGSRKRSDRKEKREKHSRKELSDTSNRSHSSSSEWGSLPRTVDKMVLSSLGRCSLSEQNAASLDSLSQFIADAINEDPDKIRKQLAAVAKAKAEGKGKKKQQVFSPERSVERNSLQKHGSFKPLASSSPQSTSSPEKAVYTHSSIYKRDDEMHSNTTLDNSVFQMEDSTSQVPMSLQELESKGSSSKSHESLKSAEKGIYKHVIPQFGETYTLRNAHNRAHPKPGVPSVDPLGHRAHEIEQRLDQSFSPSEPLNAPNAELSELVAGEGPLASLTQNGSSTHFATPLARSNRLDTSVDSAVESMSSSVSQATSVNRHSWPETNPTHQLKHNTFTPDDHSENGLQETRYTALVERVNDFSSSQGTFSGPELLHPLHQRPGMGKATSTVQPNKQFEVAPQVKTSFLGTTGLPATMSSVLPGHTMPPLSGFPGHTLPGVGPLSQTTSPIFGPGVYPLGSTVAAPQGFGMMNTFPSQVPFVQTVSATMVPKPSSLTPTYVQSFGSNVPYNMNSQQVPLHLQTGNSSISAVLPTTLPQQAVHSSVPPYMQNTLRHVNSGLLQVRTDLPQGTTTLLSAAPVILPGEVKFPPVCCVGVITETVIPLHNSSSRWMHCEIHSILSTSNGVQVPSNVSAFSVQPKVIIAPHNTENVKISVEPKEPGTFTTQLQVCSFPVVCEVQPVAHSLGPVLALDVIAEEPRVEVLLEDGKTVDFGEVSSGGKQCKPLRLINRCRAQVPVRIIISANSASLHCFTFADADFTPKKDVLVGPSPAMSKGAALTIYTVTLKGQLDLTSKLEPIIVWLLFQAPKKGHSGNSSLSQPDEYIARLDIEIDSAQQGPTISSVLLKAFSGVVKLHTPHKLQVINLTTSVAKRVTRTIPVKNAGNITARVELKIEGDLQQFSVRPGQLLLKPEQESEVQIAYQPAGAGAQVESVLVLAVPDGPVYEVLVKGSVVLEEDDSSVLLSSKPVLCWGGVALGWSQQQKVVLKAGSTSPVKKLQLHIEGNHSDFQIQPTFHSHSDNPESPIVMLGAQKELPVHVVFSPSSMGLISSALIIKSLTGKTKSKIPLYGCGGTSQLVLLDIRQLSEGYVTNIGEVSLGRKNAIKVAVRNSGTRAAFVKAVCYSDIHSLQFCPPSHLKVLPNNFVLSERTSKQVLIEYQPTEKDAVNCQTAVNSVAVIAFYTGDEFIRRHYKNHLTRHHQQQPFDRHNGSLLAGINFSSDFQDEDKLIEDVRYPKIASWDNFFQGCVSRVLLTLVGSPPGSSATNRHDPNSSVDVVPISDNPASASKRKQQQQPVTNENSEEGSWNVIPDHLILSPPLSNNDKASSEKVEIVNFSERALGFEFTWPAHSVIITPERGEVPPRSQTRVLVSAKSNLLESQSQLPWGGTIYLKCDGSQKAIKVQIREELVMDSSPYQPGSLSFQSIPTTAAGQTPLPADHLPPLKIKAKDIEFVDTQIGKVSASEIVVINTTSSELKWDLSSLAPAYVKVDETGSIFRSTYPAFHVGRHSGSIEGGKTIQIAVKFQPRNVGQYSQSWDLQTLPSSSKRHHHFKQRIILHGQAVDVSIDVVRPNDKADVSSTTSTKKVTISEPPRSPFDGKRGVYLAERVIQFPVTAVGQSSVAKVKICNDSEDSHLVRVASPAKPFSVQHLKFSVRPKRFVRVPVTFTPTELGQSFESSLVLTAQPDIILTVQLIASSTS